MTADKLVRLPTLAEKVALVRCGGCGAEWQDMDAATHSEGFSEIGCPNRCGRLTTPVYWPDADTDKWTKNAP